MEQAIQESSTVNAKGKGSADLLKMIGAVKGKGKGKDNQAAKGEVDLNALAPFIQLLNQQMREKSKSSAGALNVKGTKISLEQAMSLLQGDIDLQELQKALSGLAKSGDLAKSGHKQDGEFDIPFEALLKEIDLLKKNLAATNIKNNADGKHDIKVSVTDAELIAKNGNSENEQKVINDKNAILNSPAGITTEKRGNQLIYQQDTSPITLSKVEGKELKKVIPTKSGAENAGTINPQLNSQEESSPTAFVKVDGMDSKKAIPTKSTEEKTLKIDPQQQAQSKDHVADSEIKSAGVQKEKLPVFKTDEKAIQPDKVIFKEAQLSANTVSKIAVNPAPVKEESKAGKNTEAAESAKEDHVIENNSHLSLQETKEALISRNNLRFAQVQYQNTANANNANKAQIDTMQAIMEETAGTIKVEQKGKTISYETGNEEISLNTTNAVGSGSSRMEKSNSIAPGEIVSQVAQEIKEIAANEGGRVKITLNPPSLGKLEMDVIVRNGKVEVVLVADNKDVQQTLNAHIDKLKGSLQTQGLTIERCDVFMQDKRDEYQQNFSQQAFYQDGRSGQGSNRTRQEISEEKVKAPIPSVITDRPVNISSSSTDSISLFA
ncbi:MAG: hypothetical protein CVU52_01950 [Deltaproteobacteria bacterium HGW-Deltaproteobacteria-10]|nr:MAG: hypothetical protein CVU52_01950 [Deltaproteobacteria bacterium HGW-Deltaproteobacteria-10]